MPHGNTNFRSTKCQHNDSGYWKFRNKCRNPHAINVCEDKKCDKKCNSRHPIPCKYEKRCKFLVKKVCAFSHAKSDSDDPNDNLECELVGLKIEIESMKKVNEKTIK